MKGTLIFIIAFNVLFTNNITKAQSLDKPDTVSLYWFTVKLDMVFDVENKRHLVSIEKVYSRVSSGSFAEFANAYKINLKKNKLLVGPFSTKEVAKHAIKVNRLCMEKNRESCRRFYQSFQDHDEFYSYFVKPQIDKDKKTVWFKRMPARVDYRTIPQFIELMHEGFIFELFLVGPFTDYILAEKSKYISRKYGEAGFEGKETTPDEGNELYEMARNWESIPVKATATDMEEDSLHVLITIEISFPEGYFNENTMQALSFSCNMNDQLIYLGDQTIQGPGVLDNNMVIWKQQEKMFPMRTKLAKSNINNGSVIIKSILISDLNLIDCKDRIIPIEQ
jgi:hypothetical protein